MIRFSPRNGEIILNGFWRIQSSERVRFSPRNGEIILKLCRRKIRNPRICFSPRNGEIILKAPLRNRITKPLKMHFPTISACLEFWRNIAFQKVLQTAQPSGRRSFWFSLEFFQKIGYFINIFTKTFATLFYLLLYHTFTALSRIFTVNYDIIPRSSIYFSFLISLPNHR